MMRPYLGLVVPVLLLLAACGPDEGASLPSGGAASNEYWLESLPRMVAASDVVVLGTVVDIQKDVMLGTPPEEIYMLHADLDLQETVPAAGEVRQSVQVVSGIAREEAVGRPPIKEGTMPTALQDPPTRLMNLPSPPVGPPSEPVKPPGPFSFVTGDTGMLLERLERLRSTAAGNSPHAPKRRAEDRSAVSW